MPYADVSNAVKVAAQMGNLTENLSYQGLEQGVVFTRDNTMSFGVSLDLVSTARATPDVRLGIRDRLLRAIQGSVPIGATVRLYLETHPCTAEALREHAPVKKDGSSVERLLQSNFAVLELLRQHHWVSETQAYLTVSMRIPGRSKNTPFSRKALSPLLEKAQSLQNRLSRQLTLGGMRARPMTQNEVWHRILNYFNPSMVSAHKPAYRSTLSEPDLAAIRLLRKLKKTPKAALPNVPSMRAQVACSDIDLDYDRCFMLGYNRVGIVSFLHPSGTTRYDASDRIIQALGGTHSTFVVEYQVVDAPAVRAEINESLDKQDTAASDPTMKAGRELGIRVAEGTAVVQQMEMGQVLTEMSMHAMIYARDQEELDRRCELVLDAFGQVGGSMPRMATSANGVVLFLENAPFSGKRSSYPVGAYYRNAVDCMPKVGPWAGTPGGVLPLRSRTGQVFSISPVGRGVKNAGVVVAGSSGNGKSVFISMLGAALVHARDAGLTVIDPKNDYEALFMALGAMSSIVTVAPGARLPDGRVLCINPFDLPVGMLQPDAEKQAFLLEFLRALRIHDLSSLRGRILQQAIKNFYLRFSRPVEVQGQEVNAYTQGFLSDFADILGRLNTVGDESILNNKLLAQEVRSMANELRAYCGNTPLGPLLDGVTTVDVNAKYLYLNISGMIEFPLLKEVGMLLTNELTWQRTIRTMTQGGTMVMVMEEAGVAKTLPGLVALTERMFKTGRSEGIIPILALQNVQDALAYAGVINNASTRVLFPSVEQERAQVAEVFGLNGSMQTLHASLTGEEGRYREALVLQGDGQEMNGDVGQLWLSREAYWMSTSVKSEADLRESVALELFGGDQARAALHLAQEERHAA
ncbi:VirB4 family type IV secretion system protein [Deinococcus ruber]|uniref:TraG P-loop domain-containing protein n=1 Tax=Deinococcus ruber TaxID=1848197 RepID=A0A918FA20_9DEIO|nr:TraC family protein [Deinococcus ruber]GGR15538.1 hypothetical protein GCM10008957_30350 [Deinococcus ruber]